MQSVSDSSMAFSDVGGRDTLRVLESGHVMENLFIKLPYCFKIYDVLFGIIMKGCPNITIAFYT